MRPVMTDDTAISYDITIVSGEPNPLDVLDYPATEQAWLPIIGPTAMVLARRLVVEGDAFYLASDLARELGVGVPRLWQAFKRLERVNLVDIEPSLSECKHEHVIVRAYWPVPKAKVTS